MKLIGFIDLAVPRQFLGNRGHQDSGLQARPILIESFIAGTLI